MRIAPLVFLLVLAGAPSSARAVESLQTCKGYVDTLPATISTSGIWCLRKDVATGISTGAAITIAANNVTLDCNGFKLGGLAAGAGTRAIGVAADNVDNITLRNCSIRGFEIGAWLDLTGGTVVEDNRFESNTVRGLHLGGGELSIVRRNLILDTGGTSHPDDWGTATALQVYGPVHIRDNVIDGVTHGGLAIGIFIDGQNVLVEDNRIGGFAGPGYGIYTNAAVSNVFRRNALFGPGVYGLFCSGGGSNNVSTQNVVTRFTYPHFGTCSPNGDIVN